MSIYIDNKQIPRVDLTKDLFLNRLTILYGPSGSGKSVLIRTIVNSLIEKIPIGFVCCPTARSNGDYDNIFPSAAVHDDLTATLMQKIFKRQKSMIDMYNLVRDVNAIRPLYECVKDYQTDARIQKNTKKMDEARYEIPKNMEENESIPALQELETVYNEGIVKLMRKCINRSINDISNRMKLSELQQAMIKNFNINPNILLIVDDCAARIKEWKDLTETKELFFQGRHMRTTVVLTMQSESLIPPPLRINAHINIFTTRQIATVYFKKETNGLTTDDRKFLDKVAAAIFAQDEDGKPNFKKMVSFGQLIKTEHKIQFMVGDMRKKRFGSAAFWKIHESLVSQIHQKEDRDFMRMFDIKKEQN